MSTKLTAELFQQYVAFIDATEEPESVTNQLVASMFDFLYGDAVVNREAMDAIREQTAVLEGGCDCSRIEEATIDEILSEAWGAVPDGPVVDAPVDGERITVEELEDLMDDGDGEALSAPDHEQRIDERELDMLLA